MVSTGDLEKFFKYLDLLETKIGSSAFQNWFSSVVLMEVSSKTATVGTHTQFKAYEVEKRFGDVMHDVWTTAIGPIDRISVMGVKDLTEYQSQLEMRKPPHRMRKPSASYQEQLEAKMPGHGRAIVSHRSIKTERMPMLESTQIDLATALDDRMTFDDFCIGTPNRIALMAARAVVCDPDQRLVTISGASGLGKTHLLNAIGHECLANNASANVLYLTYDNLLNNYVQAVLSKNMTELRAYLNKIDILLVDDVHMLLGRKATQEELLTLIDRLNSCGKKVVVAANMPPARLAKMGLVKRLTDRLAGGTSVGIDAPDYDLRHKILCRTNALLLPAGKVCAPDRYLELIARACQASLRELKGAFNTLLLHMQTSKVTGEAVSPETVIRIVQESVEQHKTASTMDDVMRAVTETHGVREEEIRSKSRLKHIVNARHSFSYISREAAGVTLKQIGAYLDKDHTTIISSIKRAKALSSTDPDFGRQVSVLMEKFQR